MAHQSSLNPSRRECTYLVRGRTGIYSFRWNVADNGTYRQTKLSLRTRDYLKAINLASTLALKITSIGNITPEDVQTIYREFKGETDKVSKCIHSLYVEEALTDLAPKSRLEYQNCWLTFTKTLDASTTITTIRKSHIEKWKATQTCSETTLKKKLRLLSSCFSRLDISYEPDWFRLKIKSGGDKSKRALEQSELEKLFSITRQYKPADQSNRAGAWKYYLPRLAALTGCRLNEIAQMRVGDVTLTDKPFLSINDSGDTKRLKNRSSRRNIPVSSQLHDLLIPLVQGRKKSELLFNDLPYREVGGYAPVPSKWFTGIFKAVFNDSTITFHSIRHYVVTSLFNNNCHEDLIAELVGHSIGKRVTGKVYMSGFNFDIKLAAISTLTICD